jgi:hypothetical protein
MHVSCDVATVEVEGGYARIDGLEVTCTRCRHCVEVFGTSGASARAAAVLLREECPKGEHNYYVVPSDDGD